MKKLLFILTSLFFIVGLNAQDDAEKTLKKATRLLSSYNLSPSTSGDKLIEAQDLLDKAMSSGELKGNSKAYLAQGQIYNELLNKDVQALVLNQESELLYPEAAMKAFEGFKNALQYAEKGYEKNDALKGIGGMLNNVNYMGSIYYQRQKFADAYTAFNATLEGDALLKSNSEGALFETKEEIQEQTYYAGVAALSADMTDEASAKFESLYADSYANAGLYEALYKLKQDSDPDGAAEILVKGREIFPDDVGLLYAEINYYLAAGKLNDLIDKLKIALEKESDNLSVMTTLGNVYDQLYQKELAAGNEQKSKEYFDGALKYYNMALDKDADYFDAHYSIGALYYNKAASLTTEMNALSEDYSKEGSAKYEKAKAAMGDMFAKALPFFKKAESLKGDDLNTLIALKEIYARQNDFESSNKYKALIESQSPEEGN